MGIKKKSVTRFHIISDTCHPVPFYLNRDKLFIILSNHYCNPEWDSNLGPKHLSLPEFETWPLRPLGHHGRLSKICYCIKKLHINDMGLF